MGSPVLSLNPTSPNHYASRLALISMLDGISVKDWHHVCEVFENEQKEREKEGATPKQV